MDKNVDESKEIFHFDLAHVTGLEGILSSDLTFHMGSKKYPIHNHTPETLSKSKECNKAISLIADNHINKITHFAEVPTEDIPNDKLCFLQVTASNKNPSIPLPDLLLISFYIPRETRLRHFQRKLGAAKSTEIPCKSSLYGVTSIDPDIQESVWCDLEEFVTPLDAAIAVLSYHPELGSANPNTASIIKYDHICNCDNKSFLNDLAQAISEQGKGKWAEVSPAIGPDGKEARYEYDIKDEQGNTIHNEGDIIYQYTLSNKTLNKATSPLGRALKTSKDDLSLQNKKWSVSAGLSADSYEQKETPSEMNRIKEKSPQGWTIKDRTHNYGLYVYRDSIKIDEEGIFHIDYRNIFLRSLGAYIQFFDDNNELISIEDLVQIPDYEDIKKCIQPDPQKKFLNYISAVNTVMGVPVPIFADTMSFPFPEKASSVKLIFGGLGTSDWDLDVMFPGVIGTLVFQFGMPAVFLVVGDCIESTALFKKIMEDKEFLFALISAAAFLVVGVETARAVTGDTKAVISSLLSTLANSIMGILYKKGLDKLLIWVLTKIAAAELENAAPFVGWAFAIAKMASTAAQLAETTVECLASPAKIEVDIKRQMSLELTLGPDPKHGEPGNPETAVWPSSADHYQVTVMYRGGTKFVNEGPMYKNTSHESIVLDFKEIPKGGELQIIAGIYSAHNTLVGKWESGWIPAFPSDPNSNVLSKEGNIDEILVPLTSETQYIYKEKIAYANQKHVWVDGEQPQATALSLDCSNIGSYLCELVNISINNKFNQLGYCWKASNLGLPTCGTSQIENGQAYVFQNISILSDPDSHLKFPNCSSSIQPSIAYDQYGNVEEKDDINLEHNFYLEPHNGTYHLRQIDLADPSQIIDLQTKGKKSWGRFSQAHLDSIIIHPDGYVIAVSWMNHKMEILQIPDAPSDDDKAVESQFVSGEGVREGLMNGPIALTVTPDGRILILESINRRIQAFDTKGNPVPSFAGEYLFKLDGEMQVDLNNGIFSDKLQELFQINGLTYLCDISDPSIKEDLNKGDVSRFAQLMQKSGFYASYDKDHPEDQNISSYVDKIENKWRITDPVIGRIYDAVMVDGEIKIYENLNKKNSTITVRSQDKSWIITDQSKGRSYTVTKDDNDNLELFSYLSTMQLHDPDNNTYLDLAVESKGYIYVLLLDGNDKSDPASYMLDIYEPNGSFLTRTKGVNAARIAVNLWRDLYTLNYEMILGPGGRPEPSISHWYPNLKNIL